MGFEAQNKMVGDILNKSVFKIPRNQRRYVWAESNWKDFIDDIIFSCKQGAEPYFIGSIVLKDEGKQDGISYYTVIDGQQRLTTIAIVLMAIMKSFSEMNMDDDFSGTIDYLLAKNNKNKKSCIISSEYHQSIDALVKAIALLEQENNITIKELIATNTISKSKDKKIGDALKYFYDAIQEEINKYDNKEECLLKIRDAVTNMLVISIVASTEEDSYTIFEILNARGQALEDYELLKNYIMRYIQPEGDRDDAKMIWQEMEIKLGSSIKKFINHYAHHKYKNRSNSKESAYQIIHKETKGSNISDLLKDIKLKSEYYLKFINPICEGNDANCSKFEFNIFKFFKANRQEQFRPLVLSLIHQNDIGNLSQKDYENALKFIYNFFVCYTLIGKEKSNKLQDIVYKYAEILENSYSKDNLSTFGKSLRKKLPSLEWFERIFKSLAWSNHTEVFSEQKDKEKVKIILEIVEKFVSQRDEIGEFTIEHILPDSEDEKNASIGNLIPLESSLNKNCAAKPLVEKYPIYNKSNFMMARNLQNQYKDNEFSVDKRAKYLSKLIYNNILELEQVRFDENN